MSEVAVANPPLLKALLVLGVAGFGVGAIAAAGYAFVGATTRVAAASSVAIALFFGWLTFAGWPLLRFLGHRLELDGADVRVVGRDRTTTHPWSSLRFRVHPTAQVIEAFDRDGNRIYAVDYMAHNARVLLQRILVDPPDPD